MLTGDDHDLILQPREETLVDGERGHVLLRPAFSTSAGGLDLAGRRHLGSSETWNLVSIRQTRDPTRCVNKPRP